MRKVRSPTQPPAAGDHPGPGGAWAGSDDTVGAEPAGVLPGPGCPACRSVQEAERGFFSWLRIESYGELKVQEQLRAAMGMCPAHSRRLIDEVGKGNVSNAVAGAALEGARDALRGALRPGPCPACDAAAVAGEHAVHVIESGLRSLATARLSMERAGLCLDHFLKAARVLEPSTLKVLAERLLATLTAGGELEVEALAGVDPDATRRAALRERLTEQGSGGGTVEDLCALLSVDACPVCASAELVERRYAQWFVAGCRTDDDSLRTDAGEMCAAHLHDLSHCGPDALRFALQRKRAARTSEMEELLDTLSQAPGTARRGRRAGGEDLERACKRLLSARTCPACHARAGVETRQIELVSTALALSPVRDRYERGHGLCVRHALRMPADRGAHAARRCADARVGVLAWEVQEVVRKESWAYRHEPDGPERDAWLRALVQVDGRILCGCPARPES